MPVPRERSSFRPAVAGRLRRLANRLDRRSVLAPKPGPAPLVRIGGRWWQRDDLAPVELDPPRDA
jgi:hypothetical protein